VADHRLSVAVWGPHAAVELGAAARRVATGPIDLHLKADTGMGRLGVRVDDSCDAAVELAGRVAATEGVRLAGLFSNLATADAPPGAPGAAFTGEQVGRFARLCAALDARGLLPEHRHLANSAAIQQHAVSWAADWCNGVRPGLALYGASLVTDGVEVDDHSGDAGSRVGADERPGRAATRMNAPASGRRQGDHGEGKAGLRAPQHWPRLEPVMSWHSAVAAVREVPAGWPLGYGAGRRAERASTIGVVPVGYHDGLPRALGDRAEVLVAGRRAKVVGAISMDLTLVDISAIPDARVGAPVVIFGRSAAPGGDSIAVAEVAGWAGSIAHEVLCRVSKRVPRRFVETVP
jgi:alanine racemase